VAAWGQDGTIRIWDANSGQLSAEIVRPESAVAGAWSPDDKLLASGNANGTVTIFGTHAGDKVVTLQGHVASVYDLAWSPDGKRIASGGLDSTVRIWDVVSQKMVLGPLRHSHRVMSVAWEPDGHRLATGSADETVKIWNTTTGHDELTLRGHRERINSLAWGPNGRLASTCALGSLRIWSPVRDQEAVQLSGHFGPATSVAWSPSGKRLASGGDDGKVFIWDPTTHETVLTISPQFGAIRALAWNPDTTLLASAGGLGGAVNMKVWEVADVATRERHRPKPAREVFALPADKSPVCSLAWSADGTRLAAGSGDGTIRVVEGIKKNPKVQVIRAHRGLVRSLAWSSQGDRLASAAGSDASDFIKVWDPIRGTELARMHDYQSSVYQVAWSPDGKRLASASTDRLVIAWDVETGRRLATMSGHNDYAAAVVWSPDGTRLASGGIDNSVRVWDPRTGEETLVLRGTAGAFSDVSWHPDGVMLAAACSDGLIWIWDATRGFERDPTARSLPYIDRLVASGTARGQDLLCCAQSYFRAGKPREALALVKDNPSTLLRLYATLTPDEQRALTQLRPDIEADWLQALSEQPDLAQKAFASARTQVASGVAAFESGRLADAIRDLRSASNPLLTLWKVNPNDDRLASNLGICFGFLGGALRDSRRPVEALAAFQEARSALESMRKPAVLDLYNLACDYAQLSVLVQHAANPQAPAERESLAEQSVQTLRKSLAAGMKDVAILDRDHDLDPLRERPDFRALIEEAKAKPKPDAAAPPKAKNDR
jgi:WD40 repeat protein